MARLEITTHVGCPMNCLDCPQKLLLSKYHGKKFMDYDDYTKVIDKIPQGVRIDFSGMCEPFVNPRCTDMILYAANHGNPLALYTTLQGATLEDYERLKDVKYEVVTIHLPDREGRSTFKITDDYLKVLEKWDCNNYSCHGTIDERVLPYLKQRNLITYMHDRAGNLEHQRHFYHPEQSKVLCINCGNYLDHNVLLPDGTLLVCCMDYGMTHIFGNLFEQEYANVLNSDDARQLRIDMQERDCICKHCTNAMEY